ncbi:2-oxoglutarate dehydrogenase complex dihydrolipoyllysine-residue succinyltransferase [bacterium]|nr:2-oxoglutarate dehydrogenase complex dihydrolipoyllysine-residue succinyltransferase [bacterium]
MVHDIVAPTVGESISEVRVSSWNYANGDYVTEGETLAEIESDKATVEVVAEHSGSLNIIVADGEMVPVGEKIATLDDSAEKPAGGAAPKAATSSSTTSSSTPTPTNMPPSPSASKMLKENNVSSSSVAGTGKRGQVTKTDVLDHLKKPKTIGRAADADIKPKDPEGVRRVPMSLLRLKIAERLKDAQNTAAILTTFNEVDLTNVMALRKEYKDKFKAKHDVGLGFMSFFTRAVTLALKEFEAVNASIDGTDILYNDHIHMGVAVGTDRGLVVPVLRNVENMTFLEIEKGILSMALKARDGKLGISDMSGGTFTISNGGVYGSMLSTPILNPPQSAILGMHNIMERPVNVNGKVEIRPMMYLAVSYDHRIIDGKGAVSFLIAIKNRLENPEELGLDFKKDL